LVFDPVQDAVTEPGPIDQVAQPLATRAKVVMLRGDLATASIR
jgi:hypothetical protein